MSEKTFVKATVYHIADDIRACNLKVEGNKKYKNETVRAFVESAIQAFDLTKDQLIEYWEHAHSNKCVGLDKDDVKGLSTKELVEKAREKADDKSENIEEKASKEAQDCLKDKVLGTVFKKVQSRLELGLLAVLSAVLSEIKDKHIEYAAKKTLSDLLKELD